MGTYGLGVVLLIVRTAGANVRLGSAICTLDTGGDGMEQDGLVLFSHDGLREEKPGQGYNIYVDGQPTRDSLRVKRLGPRHFSLYAGAPHPDDHIGMSNDSLP